jgi:hypothetical protein
MKHDWRLIPLIRNLSALVVYMASIGCATQQPTPNAAQKPAKPEPGVVNSGLRERKDAHPSPHQANALTNNRNSEAAAAAAEKTPKLKTTGDDNPKLEGDDIKLEGDNVKLEGN